MSHRCTHPRSGRLVLAATLAALAACADAGPTAVSPADAGPLATVSPTTLSLVSGAGSIGGVDAANPVSTDGGATWQPASIIAPIWAYAAPIPGSNWIAPPGPEVDGSTSIYRATFTLPATFTAPSLAIRVHADNYAAIRLNGSLVGAQPAVGDAAHFQDDPEAFATANAALFQPGTNVLEIVVGNIAGPSALDYAAEVTFTPAEVVTYAGLCELTRQVVAHHGVAGSLCAKLEAAARAAAAGDAAAAHGSLQAYIHEVRAQRGKKIAPADADTLIALAGQLL